HQPDLLSSQRSVHLTGGRRSAGVVALRNQGHAAGGRVQPDQLDLLRGHDRRLLGSQVAREILRTTATSPGGCRGPPRESEDGSSSSWAVPSFWVRVKI